MNSEKTSDLPKMVTEKDVAQMLAVSRKKLQLDRALGRGLRFVRVGRCIRYDVRDLEAYLDRNCVVPLSEKGQTEQTA